MESKIIFFLISIIILLVVFILYNRFVFNRDIKEKLNQIIRKLEEISETDSDEKVIIFTDNKLLMELAGQINCILTDRQKTKADFMREKISSKKMLANISHDIKTPLTVILGYLEIMRLNNKYNESLEKVELKAKQVMELVNQFFTLAKLESKDTKIKLCKINISEVCRESILSFYDILLQKDFTVDISIPETAVFVQGDKESLQRILSNLLSNVIRYGDAGKYLGVFLRNDKDNVYIDVTDRGKGIKKEFAPYIFNRLYTVKDFRNREIKGSGLGLAIAKNLAIQLGGGIFLRSIPDEETTFTVQLKKYINTN